jgi:AraC-like DNA-binding protein
MGFIYIERRSDSPYVETITEGYTEGSGTMIRPAESHWHLVITRAEGNTQVIVVGPLSASGVVGWTEGVEITWIRFKLGTFMPHLPARMLRDKETALPDASSKSFWLKGSAWQFPTHENADTFIERLARADVLAHDPIVQSALQGQRDGIPERTLRHRFLQTTGVTQSDIYQLERAQRAAAMLEQGVSILDTVFEAGYTDQPHLTRSLKRWIGHTPAQLRRQTSE